MNTTPGDDASREQRLIWEAEMDTLRDEQHDEDMEMGLCQTPTPLL